jgi:UDP-N-acetylmuramate--alanine ligase
MENIDFTKNDKKIYFSGIGGISMSGLAEILHHRGFEVIGSDVKHSETTQHLESLGIKINYAQLEDNITDDIDLLVNTAAVKKDNPEMVAAAQKGIKTMERSKLLGAIMKNYKYATALSGTHGKTTTTSMLSHILLKADKDPTISVGGMLDAIGGNIRIGGSEYFITEACEYCDSFLEFFPYIGVILNIEADHLDYFKDIHHIRASFTKFASLIPDEGALIINGDEIDQLEEITGQLTCKVITFGMDSKNDWSAQNIGYNDKGLASFDILYNKDKVGKIMLSVPGQHNVYNALAATAAAYEQGIDMATIISGLQLFCGTHRRFEYKGEFNGATIIDDYAHHPTEIKAALSVANDYQHNKLWCVFQPHTYTRTKALLDDFSEAFDNVDTVIIADIYAAREENTIGIYAEDLVEKIKERGKNAMYLGDFQNIAKYLMKNVSKRDLLITMGAGEAYMVGEALISGDLSTLSTGLSTNV